MNHPFDRWYRYSGAIALGVVGSLAIALPSIAQSITPAADGTGTEVRQLGNRFDIDGGQRSGDGQNLFHSFERFGLDEAQIANFLSEPGITNILGRVVGGDPSIIQGIIQVTGTSNLYLINPAGIVFGDTAQINVPLSFTATTADRIGFEEGWWSAGAPTDYASLVGNPTLFWFLRDSPGAIINTGSLAVDDGHLTLLGGTLLSTGTLNAPNGTVTLASVPGGGLVQIQQPGQVLSLEIQVPSPEEMATLPAMAIASLPQLLTRSTIGHAQGVTLADDGTVLLHGAGITVENGDLVVQQLAGQFAFLASANDTVVQDNDQRANVDADALLIWANGDVQLGDYTSGALSVQARGAIRGRSITTVPPAVSPGEVPDPSETALFLSVTLRAGVEFLHYDRVIPNGDTLGIPTGSDATITVGDIQTAMTELGVALGGGPVVLAAPGTVQTGHVATGGTLFGSVIPGSVTLLSGSNLQVSTVVIAGELADIVIRARGTVRATDFFLADDINVAPNNDTIQTGAGSGVASQGVPTSIYARGSAFEPARIIIEHGGSTFVVGPGFARDAAGNILYVNAAGEPVTYRDAEGNINIANADGVGYVFFVNPDGSLTEEAFPVYTPINPADLPDDASYTAGAITFDQNNALAVTSLRDRPFLPGESVSLGGGQVEVSSTYTPPGLTPGIPDPDPPNNPGTPGEDIGTTPPGNPPGGDSNPGNPGDPGLTPPGTPDTDGGLNPPDDRPGGGSSPGDGTGFNPPSPPRDGVDAPGQPGGANPGITDGVTGGMPDRPNDDPGRPGTDPSGGDSLAGTGENNTGGQTDGNPGDTAADSTTDGTADGTADPAPESDRPEEADAIATDPCATDSLLNLAGNDSTILELDESLVSDLRLTRSAPPSGSCDRPSDSPAPPFSRMPPPTPAQPPVSQSQSAQPRQGVLPE
jgi:filamentous hemagglutinin family protein